MSTGDAIWMALPQPNLASLGSGRWHGANAIVTTDEPDFAVEADRLSAELASTATDAPESTRMPASGTSVRIRRGRAGESAEAFAITVADDVEITANAPVGVFRATRQLLHNLRAQGHVPHGSVRSSPAVGERGLHLDAARKAFSPDWIKGLLRLAADLGITSLQWHVSENEGFRVASTTYPEIVSGEHITREEVLQIADLAASLHIDLIPSLDMPGHLRHVLAHHAQHRMPEDGGPLSERALDITDPEAVVFALTLIDDLIPLFPHSVRWHLGGDEFVDFARIDDYPSLREAAAERFGPAGSGFDLLTDFVNRVGRHLTSRGLAPRVWNDGMFRGEATALDQDIAVTWWTNWHADMRPLSEALRRGHDLVNFNDRLFYHVLGEHAGYAYPTSERIWEADWHPGLFPALPDGTVQEIPQPYPQQLLGAAFSVWCDVPDAQTESQVLAGIRRPLAAMAERAWNGGSGLTHASFAHVVELVQPIPDNE